MDIAELSTVDDQLGPGQRVRLAGAQAELGDRRDARDRLAAKAVGGDPVEVVAVAELARRVALEAKERVVLAHPAAIVRHRDKAAPARRNLHIDLRRTRIERVLEQLLQHRCGPLDHLARRDLVGDMLGQEADAVHGGETTGLTRLTGLGNISSRRFSCFQSC